MSSAFGVEMRRQRKLDGPSQFLRVIAAFPLRSSTETIRNEEKTNSLMQTMSSGTGIPARSHTS